MKPFVLFVVTSDPRNSPRPVEALRIVVGTAAWKRVDVALYLGRSAVLTVAENVDDLVDADNLERYRPLLKDLARPVYIDAECRPPLTDTSVAIEALDKGGLARLAAQSTYLLRF
jgi:hypothetical protein